MQHLKKLKRQSDCIRTSILGKLKLLYVQARNLKNSLPEVLLEGQGSMLIHGHRVRQLSERLVNPRGVVVNYQNLEIWKGVKEVQ